MNTLLPTPAQLEKLPIRAVVAYAARNARRLSAGLHGLVSAAILENAIRPIEAVSTTSLVSDLDPASTIRATERVMAAYEAAPEDMKSQRKFLMIFSLVNAAIAAVHGILAAQYPTNARDEMTVAAQHSHRVLRSIETLNHDVATAATEAARRDYEVLLRRYGEHNDVIIGEPVDCFDNQEP
jgi:hypothetical protein